MWWAGADEPTPGPLGLALTGRDEVALADRPELEAAAWVAVAGLDADRFLTVSDPVEQALTLLVTQRVMRIRELERRNLAVEIANQVLKGIKG